MITSADTPMFNLKAVVKETGLKPDTLRAWERRYGLPEPQRTESGHRLYSQNDIELLKWLMARQVEGLSISRAVELWRQLLTDQRDPRQTQSGPRVRQAAPPTARRALTSSGQTIVQADGPNNILYQLRERWISSCLNFDEQQADQILSQAFALFPAEQVCVDLLQRGLANMGEAWYEGAITVQQEHFASGLATRRIEAILAATPAPTRPERALIGCPPNETHTFAPLLLTLLLRRRGYDVLFLGANTPIEDFTRTVQTAKPQLVILTAQLLSTAVGIRELGELIYQAGVPMGYGGLIFTQLSELQNQITGHYLGNTIPGAIGQIEQLLQSKQLPSRAAPPTAQYAQTLVQFRVHQAQIETELWRTLRDSEMSHALLQKANINFGRDILAGLALGDIHFLGIDLPWVKGLLMNHYQMTEAVVIAYLRAYLQATATVLNGQGSILVSWLTEILQEYVLTAQPVESTQTHS